ncbi:hypothetical protein [Chondrinema litorale]|uniref:hypothetical protein n=1 Tax=Chondrinema litorale TaxID=2994555 RepID=UPI002542D52F|nr:hypothetical protein [Chondrinema litorale]UZR94538.1 hypothetical protein OQ292_01725 [Chondrinema litorale]
MHNRKHTTQQLRCLLAIFLLSIIVSACSVDEDVAPISSTGKVNIIVGQETYNKFLNGNYVTDTFTINDVNINGNFLEVEVSYAGGCEEHTFEMVWPESVDQIYPPKVPVILTHNAYGDLCEALITETLKIDLSGTQLNYDIKTISNIEIIVVNGSDTQNQVSTND